MLGYTMCKIQVCGDHTHTPGDLCPRTAKLRRTSEGGEQKLEMLRQTITNNGGFCTANCAAESFI